jgi:hypothetical protein
MGARRHDDTKSMTTAPVGHRPTGTTNVLGRVEDKMQVQCEADPLPLLRMESLTAQGETLPFTVVWQLRKSSRHHGLCIRLNGELP